MKCIEEQGPQARLISFSYPDGGHGISLLTKRTYEFEPGRCVEVSQRQEALREEIEIDPENPELVLHDMDLFPFKKGTDVVVQGHAYPFGSSRRYNVVIAIGDHRKIINVFGKRRCWRRNNGELRFSEPDEAPKVHLSYRHAYGGVDAYLHETRAQSLTGWMEHLPASASLYAYPRNPYGLGYVIENHPKNFENFYLPQLEDPDDPLTPENILVESPYKWHRMPLPWSTDWYSPSFFPRTLATGILPKFEGTFDEFAEVRKGMWHADDFQNMHIHPQPDPMFTSGGSMGFSIPELAPNQSIFFVGLNRLLPQFELSLPNEQPCMYLQNERKRFVELSPTMNSVVIHTDAFHMNIVWGATLRTSKTYFDEELSTIPFKVMW